MTKSQFNEIWVSESLWQSISSEGVRRRLFDLVRIIEHFYENSILDGKPFPDGIKSIKGNGKYKIRYDNARRIPFQIYKYDDNLCLRLGELLDHDEGEELHTKEYSFTTDENQQYEDRSPVLDKFEPEALALKPNRYIYRNLEPSDEERILASVENDLRYVLNSAQKTFLDKQGPILLRGTVGSGKTTVCLYRLLRSYAPSRLYVTYTSSLRRYAKEQYKRLANTYNGHPPVFLSIEELCLSLLDDSDRFPPKSKMTFESFQVLPFVKNAVRQHGVSAYILWEEIRGILKQKSDSNLPEYRSRIAQHRIVRAASEIYEPYLEYLKAKIMWDDIDLAQAALECVPRFQDTYERYEDIIVDEVQDLTDVHLQLILRLAKSPQGVFMAGDASQSIHPSCFEWEKVALHMKIELYRNNQYPPNPYCKLNDVYRTPESVLRLAKELMKWRAEVIGSQDDLVRSKTHKNGGSPVELLPFKCFLDFQIDISPPSVMVLVPTDACKEVAQEKFGVGSVFTVHEAKGLESPVVILYGFFEEDQIQHNLKHFKQFIHDRPRDYTTLLNLLHVAITRTSEQLFIISDREHLLLPPLEEFPFVENDGSFLRKLITHESVSAAEFFDRGRKLEEAGIYPQAAENYRIAATLNHLGGYSFLYKCKGLISKHKEDYEKASLYFEQALELLPEDYQDVLGFSIVREVEECQGMAALAKNDLWTASKNLISAELPVEIVIQRLCSSRARDCYFVALKTFLKYNQRLAESPLLVDYFFQKYPQAVPNIDLELDAIVNLPQYPEASLRAAQLIFTKKVKYLQSQLRTYSQAISALAKTLNTEGIQSFKVSEIFISESEKLFYDSACEFSREVSQYDVELQDLVLEEPPVQWSLEEANQFIRRQKKALESVPKQFENFLDQVASHCSPQIRYCLFSESLRKWIDPKLFDVFIINSSQTDIILILRRLLEDQYHWSLLFIKSALKFKYNPELCQQVSTYPKVTTEIKTLCARYDYCYQQQQLCSTLKLLESVKDIYLREESNTSKMINALESCIEQIKPYLSPVDPEEFNAPLPYSFNKILSFERKTKQFYQRILLEMSNHHSFRIRAAELHTYDSPQLEKFSRLILSTRISELTDLGDFLHCYSYLDSDLRNWLNTQPSINAVQTVYLLLEKEEQKVLCSHFIEQQCLKSS